VGLLKGPAMAEEHRESMAIYHALKQAFDPDGIMNPGKLLPSHPACGEGFRPPRPALAAGAWI